MISIIIPTYEQEELLQQCLSRLLDQLEGYTAEIIVVNNHPTKMLRSEISDSRVKYERYATITSPYAARNYGISIAKYEHILLLDSKSHIGPKYIETAFTIARNNDYDLTGGEIKVINIKTTLQLAHAIRYLRTAPKYFHGKASALTTNMLVRREVYALLGGFKETRSGNDVDFVERANEKGLSVNYEPKLLIYYPSKTDQEVISFLNRVAKSGRSHTSILSIRPPNPRPINMRLYDLKVKVSIGKWIHLYIVLWYFRFLLLKSSKVKSSG